MEIVNDDLDDLVEQLRTEIPEYDDAFRRAEPMIKTIRMLIGLRLGAGLKQGEVAKRMKRNKSFISRLESGRGGMPDHETLSLYVQACGGHIGLVVATGDDGQELQVTDAISLDSDPATINFFKALTSYEASAVATE